MTGECRQSSMINGGQKERKCQLQKYTIVISNTLKYAFEETLKELEPHGTQKPISFGVARDASKVTAGNFMAG